MIEWNKSFTPSIPAITEWLYVGALLLHLIWFSWVMSSNPITVVIDFSRWLVDSYSAIGFKWTLNDGSILIAAGMLSAVFVNILRRAIEGAVLGWPRFNAHDTGTLRVFILRAIGYGLLCFFGLGAWGVNVSENFIKLTNLVGHPVNLDVINIAVISVGTFLIGGFVNILDDAISSLVIHIFKRL